MQHRLFGVLQRQKTGEFAIRIGDEQLFDPPRLHQADRLAPVRGLPQDGEVLGRHHHAHGRVVGLGETHVAVGHDAEDAAALVHHGKPGEAVALGQRLGVGQRLVGRERHGVVDDTAFEPLHAADLARLRLDVEVAVDDAHAAGLRHRDRHPRLGHRVHGRGQERDVERDRLGDPRARVHVRRQHRTGAGHEKDIVEGERLANLHGGLLLDSVGGLRWHVPISRGGGEGKGEKGRKGVAPASPSPGEAPARGRKPHAGAGALRAGSFLPE
jgi:hypothetical protein